MRMKRPWWHWVIGWFVLSFAIGSPWLVLMGIRLWSAHEMFGAYMSAVKKRDFESAYAFCGRDFRRATTFNEFVRWQDGLGPLLSYKVKSTEVWGNLGISKGSVDTEEDRSNERLRLEYVLFHVEGQWKIYAIKRMSSDSNRNGQNHFP